MIETIVELNSHLHIYICNSGFQVLQTLAYPIIWLNTNFCELYKTEQLKHLYVFFQYFLLLSVIFYGRPIEYSTGRNYLCVPSCNSPCNIWYINLFSTEKNALKYLYNLNIGKKSKLMKTERSGRVERKSCLPHLCDRR